MARTPRTLHTISAVNVQPYQSMFGPSPGRGPSYPQTRRCVAGWYVTSGKLKNWIKQYANAPDAENVMAKVLNLADDANDAFEAVADVALAVVPVVSAEVAFMIRIPGCC
jgi:hypothetical protein